MWTPRRFLLLLMGFLLCGGMYTVYARVLGWVDGLPPLPQQYTQHMTDANVPLPVFMVSPIQARLQLAFGPECLEQLSHYKLKLEVRDKGLLFAAVDSELRKDGRIELFQVSVAIFGKNQEISTIHSDRAILEYDQPVRKMEDMANRKVIAAELHADPDYPTHDPRKGKIHITNNRRTPRTIDDDLLLTTPGPIYYREDPARPLASDAPPAPRHPSTPRLPHIWTTNRVEMTDKQNRPGSRNTGDDLSFPTMTAEGLRIYLTVEEPGKSLPAAKFVGKNDRNAGRVTGVDRVDLDRNVVMHLWTENRNMFGGDPSKPPAPQQEPPKETGKEGPNKGKAAVEKSLITITTNGSFYYDMVKDLAHFERPPSTTNNIPEYITVSRRGKAVDTLTCDYLDLQFRRRKPAKAPALGTPASAKNPPSGTASNAANRQEADMDIERVHAWGKDIALSSEGEKLDAYGYDLVYDAVEKQSILKGSPMVAVKDGNQIRAKAIVFSNINDRQSQSARAIGPGEIGIGEFDPATGDFGRKAIWQEDLFVTKVKEQGREMDLLTLTGGAEFRDTLNAQSLSGKQIRLWLLSADTLVQPTAARDIEKIVPVAVPAKTPTKEERRQPLPHRLEATAQVRAASPEIIIRHTDYLNVWFKDLPKTGNGPAPLPKAPGENGPGGNRFELNPLLPVPKADRAERPGVPIKQPPKQPAKADKTPVQLVHARRVETWVNRIDGRNELDKVHCEGKVMIFQDPNKENKNGVHIEGNVVDLEHFFDGNTLYVLGNDMTMGQVHFDTLSIVADDITIDQRRNAAQVKGKGQMRILSQSDLEGKKLEKAQPIDVQWDDGMELDGPAGYVIYEGHVDGRQGNATILCETMQVKLDRPVWLNQAAKPRPKEGVREESPKVERVICDQVPPEREGQVRPKVRKPVSVEDKEELQGRLLKFQRIEGQSITMNNPQNLMVSNGPGTVRLFQLGSKDLGFEKQSPEKGRKAGEEMKLTYIEYKDQLKLNNKTRRAEFLGNVEVLHFPANRHDVQIDPRKFPVGGMQMFCEEKLDVQTIVEQKRDANGKIIEVKSQEMKGKGNVRVRSEDYSGWADTVTYSEEKGLIIFYGVRGSPAILSKTGGRGEEPKRYQGMQIKYYTREKNFEVVEGFGGQSN